MKKNLFYGAGSLTPEDKKLLAEKWGFLSNGMTDPQERLDGRKTHTGRADKSILEHKKRVMEFMLESQEAHLMTNPQEAQTLTESSLTTDVASFQTVALPLVRKIYGRDLAFDLFTVYPIAQPGGKYFTLDFQRDAAGTSLSAKADFNKDYAEAAEAASTPQIKAVLTGSSITMHTKKIRGVSSIEMQQDFRSYHGLDADQELLAAEADEVVREINYEMLVATVAGATAGNVNFVTTVPAGLDYINIAAYNKTLYEAVVSAQNKVFAKKYRKPNWAISGVSEIERLEKLEEFKLSPEVADGDHTVGRHYLGNLNRRLAVYTDPWWQDTDKILVGYKGNTWLETAAVYSPHTFYISPNLVDGNDMTSRRGLMARFGFTIINGDYFATVTYTASV